MLNSKFFRKFPNDLKTRRIVESEVQHFVTHEYVTKESIKSLE